MIDWTFGTWCCCVVIWQGIKSPQNSPRFPSVPSRKPESQKVKRWLCVDWEVKVHPHNSEEPQQIVAKRHVRACLSSEKDLTNTKVVCTPTDTPFTRTKGERWMPHTDRSLIKPEGLAPLGCPAIGNPEFALYNQRALSRGFIRKIHPPWAKILPLTIRLTCAASWNIFFL